MNRLKHVNASRLLLLVIAFVMTGFIMLSLAFEKFDYVAILFALATAAVMLVTYSIVLVISKHADRFVIVVADMLIGVGLMLQYRLNPESALKQLLLLLIGTILMFAAMYLVKKTYILRKISWLLMVVSVIGLASLLFIGREVGGAKNWITIAGQQFQPSEFVKIALVLVLADWFTDKSDMKELIIPLCFVGVVVILLMLERDLGAVILLFGTALILFYTATGKTVPALLGLGAGAVGSVASYFLFDHVKARIAIWVNPWATYDTNGYQIAQGLMAIATGGMWGVGLGVGSPKLIPAYNTDYIFAVICEEFGILFGICLIAFYLVLVIRGAIIALNAPERFFMLTAFGCTALIALQSIIIIGGVIKMIPLTGITLPFVSQGGSSMIACLIMLGILEGIAARSGDSLERRMEEINEHEA